MANGGPGGKHWKEIITAASSSGLGVFALVALVVGSGMIYAAAQAKDTTAAVVLSVGAGLILLSIIYFVGRKELGKGSSPGFGQLQGALARTSFIDGGRANKLDGRWRVRWLAPDEWGKMRPYMVKHPETREEIEYPPDLVDVVTRDAVVSASAHDQTTERVYWLEGRLSNHNVASLMYWSKAGTDEDKLVGVLLLTVAQNDDSKWTMNGPWVGYVGSNKLVTGEVEWTKLSKD